MISSHILLFMGLLGHAKIKVEPMSPNDIYMRQ